MKLQKKKSMRGPVGGGGGIPVGECERRIEAMVKIKKKRHGGPVGGGPVGGWSG